MMVHMSTQQSIENYIYFKDQVTTELEKTNKYLTVTNVDVIDEFLKRKLINDDYHKSKLKDCLDKDKRDELKDLYHSSVISGSIVTFIFIFYLPSDKYHLFRICYYIYLATIYYIAYLFYKKSD